MRLPRKSPILKMAGPHTFHVGENLPLLMVVLQHPQGGYMDLTADPTINFYVSRLRSNKVLMSGAGTIREAARGAVSFVFPSVFESPGEYELQAKVTDAGGLTQRSQKLLIQVIQRTARSA